MLYFVLLSLLGTGLAALTIDSAIDGDDDDDENTSSGDDNIVEGTNNPDILEAAQNQTVNGYAGNDTIEATGGNVVINDNSGSDSLSSGYDLNVTLNGNGGSDQIILQANGPDDQAAAFGGFGNDTIVAFGQGGTVDGGEGKDLIYAQGSLNSVSGGGGNDTIFGDSADYGGGTPIYGNAGDDIIVLANSPSFQIGAIADGGAGNDRIEASTYLNSADSFDTLTGGNGEDRFELLFAGLEFDSDSPDQGVVTTITDFVPGEDVLVLPLEIDPAGSDDDVPITFEIVQADDDSYTDVIFSAVDPAATSTETAITSTATIRLLGTTNLTIADVIQANLERSSFDDF